MARILVIDDDPSILELLRSLLTLEGHAVEIARNGRQGLERFEQAPPELVITDLMMPEMEGIEMIRSLRKLDGRVPIVAMSGEASGIPGSLLRAARHLGADQTMLKPFANRDLCEVVRTLLDQRGI